jgi:hypothetical protein
VRLLLKNGMDERALLAEAERLAARRRITIEEAVAVLMRDRARAKKRKKP